MRHERQRRAFPAGHAALRYEIGCTYRQQDVNGAWWIHYDDGGDGYLTPIAGPLSRRRARRLVRACCPRYLRGGRY